MIGRCVIVRVGDWERCVIVRVGDWEMCDCEGG